jgi:hypothetical protein
MTVFQIIAVSFLVLLIAFSAWKMIQKKARKRVALTWILLWVFALAAVLVPDKITKLAHFLEIKRGADLILYCTVFAGLVSFFYLLTKLRAIQRQITLLTRQLAIKNADEPRFHETVTKNAPESNKDVKEDVVDPEGR